MWVNSEGSLHGYPQRRTAFFFFFYSTLQALILLNVLAQSTACPGYTVFSLHGPFMGGLRAKRYDRLV